MSDPFADSRAKLARGKERLDALYAEVMEAIEAVPVVSDGGVDDAVPIPSRLPDGRPLKTMTFWVSQAPLIPRSTGLLVGEALQNFRSSLDYLTWSLVKHAGQGQLSARQAKEVQFPMARKRSTFRNQWPARLRGVPTTPYRAILDDFQPYRRTPAGRAMRALRNLSDADKHRLLVPAASFPFEVELKFSVNPPSALVGARKYDILHRPVKPGTKLSTLLLIDMGLGQVAVQMEGEFFVYPELPGRLPMEATLNAIRETCTDCIDRVAAVFGG